MLASLESGVDYALRHAFDWLEHSKNMADYVERRVNLGECSNLSLILPSYLYAD